MTASDLSLAPFTLHLFGPLQAWVRGEPLPHLRSRKGYWLLSLLALRGNREVERQWLTGLLWPDSDPKLAARSLRTSLNDLRRALGPEAARLRSPTPRTLELDLTGAAVDVLAFDAAIRSGTPPALAEAVALYRGPLLEGCLETWALEERQAREVAFLGALERLANEALQVGERTTAERHLRRVVASDPLCESAQRALMQALAAGGNYAAALQVYRDLRDQLYRELNASPDPQTRTLFAAIQAKAERRSPGLHLRKNRAPVGHDDVRHNLPHFLTRFIGRKREIDDLVGLLTGPAARLVTLTGVGGAGKSRLAVAVGQQLVARRADGVWLVELAALRDPVQVPQAVAGIIGVREDAGQPLLTALIGGLRARQLLLILDNGEHLVEACGKLVETLLQGCPGLQVLVTSRAALGIAGERRYPVPPLSLPSPSAAEGPVAALLQSDAVRLFLDRATQVWPDYQLTPANATPVAAVCRRLDGLPLAIELAAARLRVLPIEEIAARLDDRFRLLTNSSRAALPRHRTLRAALDWSYDLLSPAEQRLLRRLSVFSGSFTLAAVEAVCVDAEPDVDLLTPRHEPSILRAEAVLDLLTDLMDRSLVLVQEHGQGRFRLLETVRAYGSERLRADERSALKRRHAVYYLALAEAVDPRQGARDQVAGLERLDREHDNLRAALQWSLEPEGSKEEGLRLAVALGWFWHLRYYAREGITCLEALMAASGGPEQVPLALWARALESVGGFYLDVFDNSPRSHDTLAASLRIARELGDDGQSAWSLYVLAFYYETASDMKSSQQCAAEALALFRATGDRLGTCHALTQLGRSLYFLDHDPAQVAELLEESLGLARDCGDLTSLPNCLGALARLARDAGDWATARRYQEECVAVTVLLGSRAGIAVALENLGKIMLEQGDTAAARRPLCEARQLYREMERPWGEATVLGLLGDAGYHQRDHTQALALHQQALQMWRELKFEGGMLRSLALLSQLTLEEGDPTAAYRYACEARTIWHNWEERWRTDALRHAGQGWQRDVLLRALDLGSTGSKEPTH